MNEPTRDGGAVGVARPRIEGRAKVTGAARYAADEPVPGVAHGALVLSTVARGRVRAIDAGAVKDMPGVLGVLDHTNAPRLDPAAGHFFGPDGGLRLLQGDAVPHAGRPIALVVAETPEQAHAAARALPVTYDEEPHDTAFSADHPAGRPAVALYDVPVDAGDVDAELAAASVVVDERYGTPEEHCSAMEPHSATAWWDGDRLHAVDSDQGPFQVAVTLATLLGLPPDRVRVRVEHIGGGFGSKGMLGPQLVLAAMAATGFGRPVRVTLTRAEVFLATAQRPATDQRVRIGADADGRLRAVHHTAAFEISPLAEYIEGCTEQTKTLYAAPAIRTSLTAVPLDILPPYSMRAPGAAPGSFALESAMDELAERLGMDPLELRLRNEAVVGPVSGLPFSGRNLVACLREGARRFGWASRDHRPRTRREGRLLVGTGLAATSFGAGALPSTATITAEPDGTFTVTIAATDLGTGARTALTAIAADALAVGTDRIRLRISDSDHGPAWSAGGSRGTASWAWAITEAAAKLRAPGAPVTVTADTSSSLGGLAALERHAFSAVFAEVTADPATGEVRVRRLLGMFAAGRVINPLLARSQVVGGMIGGLSMALHEEGVRDPVTGRHVNADFAGYHIAAHADVPDIEADFVPDDEPGIPWGIKGVGEIGNVGTAAAIANATWHATGTRQRRLPLRLDRVLDS
ncbi:xanthine dehydrogenase family protein molybdopterin-binding subunit [Spongiactinospora sp. TRM90649]|uniref:xanthine dehydrogenase family protein molybdopterin-binding subunit n=1 Tax=Spongiactinospora sp. TRM90649 TaxID=3031114 RepID=UPI0023F815CA|nr:xanthine dehydrogenase family protein molybdopterin-binding subunit [Spongiactinospora sp. TRM90649]MDF5754357.1 xanthine dehydrogenase family protein molybdopterin-binding subunit [Spongiactinospora sp. TRM90649]